MDLFFLFFFFKQKTAYDVRISDWSSDVCSSDLALDVKGSIENVPVNIARAVWPLQLSPHARSWVAKNMKDGTLSKGAFAIDVPANLQIGRASCRERVCQYV